MSGQAVSLENARGRRRPESLTRLRQAARRLFVERGYDATRPQDITREAGLGHGTFYLHYPDKRACFLGFLQDARRELDAHVRGRRQNADTLEQHIAGTLLAICEYGDAHPGMLRAALADERLIDADGAEPSPLLMQWGAEWAEMVLPVAGKGDAFRSDDAQIIGQAIAGVLYHASHEAQRTGRCREALVHNLTRFLTRALRPD